MFSGQRSDAIPPVCPRCSLDLDTPETWEASWPATWTTSNGFSRNVEARLHFELPLQKPKLLRLHQPHQEGNFSRLYSLSCPFHHHFYLLSWGQQLPAPTLNSVSEFLPSPPEASDSLPEQLQCRPLDLSSILSLICWFACVPIREMLIKPPWWMWKICWKKQWRSSLMNKLERLQMRTDSCTVTSTHWSWISEVRQ